jgi:transglutaminase-like putative cysteine protease
MNERVLKRILNTDVLGLSLVFAAIEVLLYGTETAIRGTQTDNLFWICLVSALLGLSGAKSKWNGTHAAAATVVLGLMVIWILGARIADVLIDLISSTIKAGPQFFPQISYRFDVDASGINSVWNTISDSSSALMNRWQAWLSAATSNVRFRDALIRDLIWTFALWLLSAWIGWFAARRNGMVALLPGAMLLTVLLWSNEDQVDSLWAFVILMLLLMGIWNYKNHEQQWETNRIDYSDSIRIDITQYLLMVTVAVGVISYSTPSISWRDIRDYFREREHPSEIQATSAPSTDSDAGPGSGEPAPMSTLPREHLLTSGYAQSEEIVMTIKTGELPPVAMQSLVPNVPRYYWRSLVYDRYDGRGWLTTSAAPQSFSAGEPMIGGVLGGYKLLHINVQMQQPEGRLHWSGMLYSADIPLEVDWRLKPQSSLFADQTALLQADMFAARTDANMYKADAFVPTPSIDQLRTASAAEYPEHIRNRYLALPDALPQRVHRLAGQITAGQATPYDKANAIETYLRTNYPYDLNISAPPQDQDVADYFLFDLKSGYCDYYATAMVVLARSSGLPARFVSGYAAGDYDMPNAQYIVRELHAHSWVEVYFSEVGWVEFEPTGNQPEIERAETNLLPSANDGTNSNSKNFYPQLTGWTWGVLFIPFAIIVVGILYYLFIEPLLIARLTPTVAIEVLYRRLYRSARPLAGKHMSAETAEEFMHKLIRTLQTINAQFDRSQQVLQQDVKDLTRLYQTALFSNRQLEQQDVRLALRIWNRLRWLLPLEQIKYRFWIRNKVS